MTRDDKIALGVFAILLAVVGIGGHYSDKYENSPERLEKELGPPAYVSGPNADSEECKNLRKQWLPLIDAGADAESAKDDQSTAEFERIMRSPMTEGQREGALQRLFARQDISTTALESKFREADTSLRNRELESGCLVINEQLVGRP